MKCIRRSLSIGGLGAVLFLTPTIFAAADGPQRSTDRAEQPVSETQVLEIHSFFQKCLKKDHVATLDLIEDGHLSSANPDGLVRISVDRNLETEGGLVQLSSRGGKVLAYVRGGDFLDESHVTERRLDEAISEDAAWESIKPVLTYHDLPLKKEEYTMTLVDTANLKGEGDLYGGAWEIKKDFSYQGRPCRNSRIILLVSANSGKLWAMHYSPLVVPEEADKRVGKADAMRAAGTWLDSHGYFRDKSAMLSVSSSDPVREVVARPNNTWVLEDEVQTDEDPSRAYFCWEIPFEFVERDHSFRGKLWVRVDTGRVIGGSERDS